MLIYFWLLRDERDKHIISTELLQCVNWVQVMWTWTSPIWNCLYASDKQSFETFGVCMHFWTICSPKYLYISTPHFPLLLLYLSSSSSILFSRHWPLFSQHLFIGHIFPTGTDPTLIFFSFQFLANFEWF